MRNTSLKHAAWLGVLLAGAVAVQAVPTLRISSGADTEVIKDDDHRDLFKDIPGYVSWGGVLGGWWATVSVGVTKPYLGSASSPEFSVTFKATRLSNSAPTSVTFEFSETDFTVALPAGAFAEIGGTVGAGGTLTYETYLGLGNNLFDKDVLITSLGPFPTGSYSGTDKGSVPSAAIPVSFTTVIRITASVVGKPSSGEGTFRVPDAGSTVSLLGLAMAGLALLARSRRK